MIPLAINSTLPNPQGIWLPDGRRQTVPELPLKSEDIERMRQGYVCAKCWEPFETPWPERCPECGAPIRTEQAAYFAREFGGTVQVGPTTSLSDEIGMIEEHRRKEDEQRAKEAAR